MSIVIKNLRIMLRIIKNNTDKSRRFKIYGADIYLNMDKHLTCFAYMYSVRARSSAYQNSL